MDNFSIDIFIMHAGLLNDFNHHPIKDKFEGKTEPRYYKKYIQNNGQV